MWLVVFLIGIAMFVASLVIEKKSATAGTAPDNANVVDPLRIGGVVLATLGLCAMAILSAASGGLFAAPPA